VLPVKQPARLRRDLDYRADRRSTRQRLKAVRDRVRVSSGSVHHVSRPTVHDDRANDVSCHRLHGCHGFAVARGADLERHYLALRRNLIAATAMMATTNAVATTMPSAFMSPMAEVMSAGTAAIAAP